MAKGPIATLSLALFVGAIYAAAIGPLFALVRLALTGGTDLVAWAILAVLAILTVLPLQWTDGPLSRALMARVTSNACRYFPIKVVLEDEDALKPTGSYVLGYEPHSALPVGVPAVFSTPSPGLPKFLGGGKFHSLASGVCFMVPLVRQLWWWLGLRPATREVMNEVLGSGGSVLLNPGGVQECLYMTKGQELVFLHKRRGFVRMAIQHGAALVPIFAFGQAASFTWYRPGPPYIPRKLVEWVSRKAGAVPLIMHGRWLTPIPHSSPITIVVGRPIEVPRMDNPPDEVVQQHLEKFILAMQELFEKHKAACGCEDMTLTVM